MKDRGQKSKDLLALPLRSSLSLPCMDSFPERSSGRERNDRGGLPEMQGLQRVREKAQRNDIIRRKTALMCWVFKSFPGTIAISSLYLRYTMYMLNAVQPQCFCGVEPHLHRACIQKAPFWYGEAMGVPKITMGKKCNFLAIIRPKKLLKQHHQSPKAAKKGLSATADNFNLLYQMDEMNKINVSVRQSNTLVCQQACLV